MVLSISTIGQSIKIQTGIAVSNLEKKSVFNGEETLSDPIKIFNSDPTNNRGLLIKQDLFIGIDYLERKHFNLSSSIGFLSKGEKHMTYDYDTLSNGEYGPIEDTRHCGSYEKINYVSVNTCIEFKENRTNSFISIGFRVDYMTSWYRYDYTGHGHYQKTNALSQGMQLSEVGQPLNPNINSIYFNRISYGGLIGIGKKFKMGEKLNFGVRGDYYVNLNNIKKFVYYGHEETISDNTFTLNLSLNYKL